MFFLCYVCSKFNLRHEILKKLKKKKKDVGHRKKTLQINSHNL